LPFVPIEQTADERVPVTLSETEDHCPSCPCKKMAYNAGPKLEQALFDVASVLLAPFSPPLPDLPALSTNATLTPPSHPFLDCPETFRPLRI
jgi:hypothetical protein